MQIVTNLKQLVASERKITAQIIELIQVIGQKKIHVQLGYPTLFAFLTEEIGYSASAAQRRIEAARILTAVPEIKEDIESGSLNLSQVALVAQGIRQKKKEVPPGTLLVDEPLPSNWMLVFTVQSSVSGGAMTALGSRITRLTFTMLSQS